MSDQAHMTIEAQAADWLSLARSGQMSEAEAAALQSWLADPAHVDAYRSMQETWRIFGELEDDPAVMEVREWALRRHNHAVRFRFAAGIAAAATLAGGWAGWWAMSPAPLPEAVVAAATVSPEQAFSTGVGESKTVTLFDGSTVTLDTNSALTAAEVGGIRLIDLKQGQAFFKVAHDKTRPFKVLAAGKTVTATGTQFSVRVDPATYQVTLVEGSVTVEAPRSRFIPGKAADLKPGFTLKSEEAGAGWQVARVDVSAATSWRSGRLTFDDRPLADAAAEMNRYSKRKVVVDPAVAATQIVGVFPAGDVEAFAKAAEATHIAAITYSDENRIELSPPRGNSSPASVPYAASA
ncbi:MAG TPA: FecR domain-containing protein, partial [Caulobacteraceae bacterium]